MKILSFGGHCCFVLASRALYAVLYVVALFVEVAYEFERYGARAAKAAPLVFLWVRGTSMAGLGAGSRLTREGRGAGLALSVYALAGLLLYGALGWLLPNAPITRIDTLEDAGFAAATVFASNGTMEQARDGIWQRRPDRFELFLRLKVNNILSRADGKSPPPQL